MKNRLLIIPILIAPIWANAETSCVASQPHMDPQKTPSPGELLNWINGSRKTAQCLGFTQMEKTLSDFEDSVRAREKMRANIKGNRRLCGIRNSGVVESDSRPPYPNPGWNEAEALLWKDPYYDLYGDIAGYDESILVSMRPKYRDISKLGRIYVALENPDTVTFLDSSNNPQRQKEALKCTPGINAEQAEQEAMQYGEHSNNIAQNISDMPGISSELKSQFVQMQNQSGRTQSSSSTLPPCPSDYVPPDTSPQPYMKGALKQGTYFTIPLGRDSKWCPTPGEHNLFVGYGVLTEAAKREIQMQLNFGKQSISQMETMIAQAKRRNDQSAQGKYWLNQMEQRIATLRMEAKKIQNRAKSGALENNLVYRNGYQQQTCWQVLSYQCPSISEDL